MAINQRGTLSGISGIETLYTDLDGPLNIADFSISSSNQSPHLDSLLHDSRSPSVYSGTSPTVLSTYSELASNTSGGPQLGRNVRPGEMRPLPSPPVQAMFDPNGYAAMAHHQDELVSPTSRQPARSSVSSSTEMPRKIEMEDMERFASPDSNVLGTFGSNSGLDFDESILGMNLQNEQRDDSEGAKLKNEGKDDNPPPWSEMRTKAGKERKRLPLACIACRRKKIRCSGEKPACKHCVRSRIPCVYKVTTRKAAPRTDYMAMLDKRLKRMEDRVIKLIPKERMTSVSRAVVKPAIPPPPPKSAGGRKRGADDAFAEELDELTKPRKTNSVNGIPPKAKDADEGFLLTEGAESLPSKELQHHLAEIYFDYVYGQSYPLLHKPSFMRKLNQGSVPPVLMLAVCAISARFSTHPQLRTEPAFLRGEQWAAPAREISLKRYDSPNITILIVYLLLGLHEFGTCQGGRSWMLGGMAQRMAYALQLHKDLDYDPLAKEKEPVKLSDTDREIRRRTMWSCFLMDRFNSSGTDRPLFMSEQYIKAQLPIKEHYFMMEISGPTEDMDGTVRNPVPADTGRASNARMNLGVSAYLIRLVSIWGQLVKYLNLGGKERDPHPMWDPKSGFQEIKSRAEAFKKDLPEHMHYSAQNLQNHASEHISNQFVFLHIVYHQIILFMNRFALPPSPLNRLPKDMPREFLQASARAAFDAANQISLLIKDAMDHLVVAPFAGYAAFFSSTVHVHGAFSKNAAIVSASKQYLGFNVKYLSKMKKHWGMFYWVAENLKELYRQQADHALQKPQAAGAKSSPVNIFQYGDWFDRYPHGVSQTDYEDPVAKTQRDPGEEGVLSQKSDLQSVEEFFATLPKRHGPVPKGAKKSRAALAVKKADVDATSSDAQQPQKPQPQKQMSLQAASRNSPHTSVEQQQQQQQQIVAHQFGVTDDHPVIPAAFAQIADPALFPPYLPHPPPSSAHLDHSPTTAQLPGLGPTYPPHVPPASAANHPGMWMVEAHPMGMMPNGTGFFEDPSTAYFMPFNLDPPTDLEAGAGDGFGSLGMGMGISAGGWGFEGMGPMEQTGDGGH